MSPSPAAAKRYYTSGLRVGDYYSRSVSERGVWFGEGAEMLGLVGEVAQADFEALCDNRHPSERTRLTVRSRACRRVGYDLNFHVPKSVSVLEAMTTDRRIRSTFIGAVQATLADIEREVQTRVRTTALDADRTTGNVVGALFIHDTARPVDGWPDPHLHAHAFVFNATFDPVEQRWKAMQLGGVKRDAAYFESRFHARLAIGMVGLGYDVRRAGRFWEVAGIDDAIIRRFSRRAKQVEDEAERRGIAHDAKLRDSLAAITRSAKRTDFTPTQLRELWRTTMSDVEYEQVVRVRDRAATDRPMCETAQIPNRVAAAIDHALEHHLERQSVVEARRVLETANRRAFGQASPDDVELSFSERDLVRSSVGGRERVSTHAVLDEEQWMLDVARDSIGQFKAINPFVPVPTEALSDEQAKAVRHLLRSEDRVVLVRGPAGTGKTRLMTVAVDLIERSGKRVELLAPTAEAARDVLQKEGFTNTHTVARFLVDEKLQRQAAGQVVWIDEAGLLGGPVFARLLRASITHQFRIILGGDQRQHHSVERGDAFRLLIEHAKLPVAELARVRRQSGEYKEAAERFARGDIAGGWQRLVGMNAIHQMPADEIYAHAAHEYTTSIARGESCLVVSPTHAERRAVTDAIRCELEQAGLLGLESSRVEQLRHIDWTVAERREPHRYEVGQVIRFNQPAPKIKPGDRYVVAGFAPGGIPLIERVASPGSIRPLPLDLAHRFDVYQVEQLELRSGDLIRFTRNLRTYSTRFTNGNIARVEAVEADGRIRLDDGRIVPPGWGHIDHGYTLTSHASQGKTVDRVIVVQSAISLAATSAEQFYVSITRGRRQVDVFTDDQGQLRERIERTSHRTAAVELRCRSATSSRRLVHGLLREHDRVRGFTPPRS